MGNPRAGGTLPNARFPGRALAAVPAITPGNSPVRFLGAEIPPRKLRPIWQIRPSSGFYHSLARGSRGGGFGLAFTPLGLWGRHNRRFSPIGANFSGRCPIRAQASVGGLSLFRII